ncbi:DNA-binding protein [Citrobacter freundii]|uniref:DNA-binding protein n=1 Tax=Citrobacter freundii TaxID=546 RepID=UPI001905A47A|nr:DNA-binding protein [Citrobacter freundii]MBJ8931657.1 DNA-binding protein [Citrobacter freundii]
MNDSKQDRNAVDLALEAALAGGKTLTAYELTKICCEALTKSGQRIPAWTVIRDMIGKGSANDINRAKAHYRAELGAHFNQRDERLAELPEDVATAFSAIWQRALTAAHEVYSDARLKDDERVSNALAQADEAEEQLSLALKHVSRLESDIQHEKHTSNLLIDQLAEVRANATNNEKRYLIREEELKKQIERLTADLESEMKAHEQTKHDHIIENDELRHSHDECRNELTIARKDIERYQLENKQQESELKDRGTTIEQLNDSLKKADINLNELTNEVSVLKQTLKDAKDELHSTATRLSDVSADNAEALKLNQQLRENLASTQGANEVLRLENERLHGDNDENRKEIRLLLEKVANYEAENKQLKKEVSVKNKSAKKVPVKSPASKSAAKGEV